MMSDYCLSLLPTLLCQHLMIILRQELSFGHNSLEPKLEEKSVPATYLAQLTADILFGAQAVEQYNDTKY